MEKKNSRKTANYYYRLHRVKKDLLCSIAETAKAEAEICIPKEEFNNSEINTSELWSTYFKFDHKSIVVQQQYSSKQYGI